MALVRTRVQAAALQKWVLETLGSDIAPVVIYTEAGPWLLVAAYFRPATGWRGQTCRGWWSWRV